MTGVGCLNNLLSKCRIRHFVACVLSMLLFTGCTQRELCYDHSHSANVRIEFDWSEAPDADPATMVVYFFPVDNSQCMRVELSSDGSGTRSCFNSEIKVPEGAYYVVCHNGDTENNVENGKTFSEYNITTYDDKLLAPLNRSDNAPRPEETDGQPVRAQASRLYTYTVPEPVLLEPNDGEPVVIVMKPCRKSTVINVRIENVRNMVPGMEYCAVISGLAESWYPCTGMPGGRNVIVPLLLTPDGPNSLKGSAEVFGDNAPHDILHRFRLYTSVKYYYDFDVTEQIHSAPDPYNINITLSGVTLPDNSDGMGVSVNDWGQSEDVDIQM